MFRIRAEVEEIEPAIWRTLEISERVPLPFVHLAMQAAFGWQDYHLHEFREGRFVFGLLHDDTPAHVIDETALCFGQVIRRKGDGLRYAYDFGDDWHVKLVVEDVVEGEQPDLVLRCVDGRRAGPPEDCGGTPGYGEFLEALLVRTHPRHKEMRK